MNFIPILIIGGFAILLLIASFWLIKQKLLFNYIVDNFKKSNVVVAGKKGTGKDLVFNKVINKRKDYHYCNIHIGDKCKIISLKAVSVEPNTYKDFINENVTRINRTFYEKKDIYISDGGVYLPSYMDAVLYKTYPSMPIFYALSRHLYENNIHVNVQNYNRLWKALREQADFFVTCRKTIKIIPFFLFTKVTTYDKYESAVANLLPLKSRMFNKFSKAQADLFKASNGEIREGWIIQRKSKVKYDTRAFEKVVLKGRRRIKKK